MRAVATVTEGPMGAEVGGYDGSTEPWPGLGRHERARVLWSSGATAEVALLEMLFMGHRTGVPPD